MMDGHINMKKKTILEVSKYGTDFGLRIPAETLGKDVEVALAYAILSISDHQRTIDPEFKTETLLEKVKGWIKCLQ